MSWLHNALTSSVMALLGSTEITASVREERTEAIRALLLEEMGDYGTIHFPKIPRAVRYATDALSLWYARGDVMAVLSAEYGEASAHQKMDHISRQFKGLLPSGISARPNKLKR